MQRSTTLLLALSIGLSGYSQLHTDKNPAKKTETKKTNLQFGGGFVGSVVYLARNVNDKNDARGYAFYANYGGTKLARISVQGSYYKPIDIGPTWYNVRAYTLEANLELMARFPDGKSFLYPFGGISYNDFKGYFTGLNDYLNLRQHYGANTDVETRWLGLNAGVGFEHAFGPVVLFCDYRMRVGKMAYAGFNIMDVCYGAGVRIKVEVLPLNKVFRGAKARYRWF